MAKKNNTGATAPKKKGKGKWLLIGLGAAALTGVLSYFGLEFFDKKEETSPVVEPPYPAADKKARTAPKTQAKPKTLKAKTTQAKKTTAKNTQSKKTTKQEQAKTTPPPKQENKQPEAIDAKAVADELYSALVKKEFSKTILALNKIKSVNDYTAVSKMFSTMFLRGVRQTIVNGALGTFSLENQKKAIRLMFLKMGLKYNGQKWTLSGIDDRLLITTQKTKVWKDPKHGVVVPGNMVLGKEIARRGEFSVFENGKKYFLVQNQHVKYYNN